MTKTKHKKAIINCYQINLHNALQANTELLNTLKNSTNPCIALIQEPYLKKNKIIYPHLKIYIYS